MAMSRRRIVIGGVAGALALVATGLFAYGISRPTPATGLGAGDYALVTTDGSEFTRASFNGHPSMLFFGFTHCPDVCPTTLGEMVGWYDALGEAGRDLKAYFVTVDPERDTPDVLADYVAWTGRVTGLTGAPEEIDKAVKAWAIYARKVPLEDGGYTMDHTASVILLNRNGDFEGTIAYEESTATAVEKLRRLVAG